jgi:hypothetical protein
MERQLVNVKGTLCPTMYSHPILDQFRHYCQVEKIVDRFNSRDVISCFHQYM